MSVWQIAAGSEGRDYADRFIRHGIAFVGGESPCAIMDRNVNFGDTIILKKGQSQILAVGRVAQRIGGFKNNGNKEWLRDFDGWDLRAWCYVDWHKPAETIQTNGLTRATIQNVNQPHLLQIAEQILHSVPPITVYEPEPRSTSKVEDEALIDELIKLGLRPGAAEDLTKALNRIRRLASFYLGRGRALTNEHDARTFLVLPLLAALGWAEQKIKLELFVEGGGRVDIGCFAKPYKGDNDDQCVLIIETKNLSQGLDYATSQAHNYATRFPSCKVVVSTNGYCYKAFERIGDTFSLQPSAYLNITNPRDRYPLDPENGGGALEILKLLLPTN